jgi:hypothetical protein
MAIWCAIRAEPANAYPPDAGELACEGGRPPPMRHTLDEVDVHGGGLIAGSDAPGRRSEPRHARSREFVWLAGSLRALAHVVSDLVISLPGQSDGILSPANAASSVTLDAPRTCRPGHKHEDQQPRERRGLIHRCVLDTTDSCARRGGGRGPPRAGQARRYLTTTGARLVWRRRCEGRTTTGRSVVATVCMGAVSPCTVARARYGDAA